MSLDAFTLAGMHGLTTLDFPGVISAIVFTQGCNFHCPYCHNPQLIPLRMGNSHAPPSPEPLSALKGEGVLGGDFSLLRRSHQHSFLSVPDVLAFLQKRSRLLDGLVISGGEPLLQPGLATFCHAVKSLGYRIKLDTNGSRPAVLHALLAKGLVDYVAMDWKSPLDSYGGLCAEKGIREKIRQCAALLRSFGIEHEFRTTCARPFVEPDDAAVLAALVRDSPWFLQEAKLTPTMHTSGLSALSKKERQALAQKACALGAQAALR